MKNQLHVPRRNLLAAALLTALAQAAAAPAAAADGGPNPSAEAADATPASDTPAELGEIQVIGIRHSLAESMNLKRASTGVVDGVVAEDIGKFPDTNLAESLQRISGVSIDRSSIGEGSKVTVRGVGPDFNLVLLNGRQMPGASINDTSASNSRAFDFANLASEAISEIDVYKTSQASVPTGGIGATINLKTARPLDNPGLHASVGVKGVHDQSNDNLPDALRGNSNTPEISGIFSDTLADGKFGIGFSGSYQKRDLGFAQASVGNGWRTFKGDENNWGTIPQPGAPGSENITNRPGPNDIYSVPQNMNYAVNGVTRERTNGQLVLQYAPSDRLTSTLDFTYSENKIHTRRNDLSVWFNFGPSVSSWTNGPVAGPKIYSETIVPATSDLAMGAADFATKAKNASVGFNQKWKVSDALNLEFDAHHSTAEDGSDSPYGSNNVLGGAGFFRGTTTVDFTHDLPVVNVALPPGMTQIDPAAMLVTGSAFRNSYMRNQIEQEQLKGDYTFANNSRLDFGVAATNVKNRSAFSNVQLDTWGGATSAADYPDSLWQFDSIGQYFSQFDGHNDPNLTDNFFVWDFKQGRQLAEDAWVAAGHNAADYRANPNFTTDRRVTEKSKSAYAEWSDSWDWRVPVHFRGGMRYEDTDVTARALVPIATSIEWKSANELNIVQGSPGFTSLNGQYKYWLPSADLSFDVADDIVVRASYGRTIGRPGWGDIQGGQTLDQLVRVDGGTGAQGNPGLRPLVSNNYDLSFEWYYDKTSYLSLGLFRKNIDNYIGTSQLIQTPFNLHTPVGGAYWNEALANGCITSDVVCIRDYIFLHHNGDPGVTRTGVDSTGHQTGTIVGQSNDPIAQFRITTPANQRSASLDGLELAWQHVFGETGFGIAANYTYVHSGLTYDNAVIGEQFALEGLSNSANLVPFYEKGPWQIRLAYNWRGQFLAARFDGAGPNPVYVEPYGQADLSVVYQFNKQFSAQIEAINLTNETLRSHGRTTNELEFATQTGRRYMFGLRYKF